MFAKSPFEKLLRSNDVPSDTEDIQIREYISHLEENLSRLYKDVDAMPEGLKWWLYDRCDEGRKSIKVHRALISPMRRIPPEIWGAIFTECLPRERFIRPNINTAPLLLGQVFGFWRRISLSTPSLWSSLFVDFTERSWASRESLIRTWLSRSGACPLSLSIVHYEDTPRLNQLISLFGPYSARYRTLMLYMPSSCIQGLLGEQMPIPSLENVTIRVTDDFSRSISISSSARSLRQLTVISFVMDPDRIQSVPWRQLTDIRLDAYLSTSRCLEILDQTPNLLHAKFCVISDPVPSRDAITLLLLRSFKIFADKALDTILDNLVLPAVCDIAIDARSLQPTEQRPPHIWPKAQLIALIERSSCPLESLTIYDKDVAEDELVELAGKMPPSHKQGRLIVYYGGMNLVTDRVRDALPRNLSDSSRSG